MFAKFGFSEGVAGHITVRDPELEDHFWVNPFGMHFAHIRVSDLALVNEKGEVGGLSDTSIPDPNGEDFCGFGTHLICLPFVWQDGVIRPLATLGGNNGQALEVNNRGQVAGEAENTTPDPTCAPPQVFQFKPVIWHQG